MTKRAFLVLQDGTVYEGTSFGSQVDAWGEVVFNTGMTGYQENLTDPSYAGQIVISSYPLIGNYGINDLNAESHKIQAGGVVVREECRQPGHYLSQQSLHRYLLDHNIPGISGLDTRAIIRKIRTHGVMMGLITTSDEHDESLRKLNSLPPYDTIDFTGVVTTGKTYQWGPPCENCTLQAKCNPPDNGAPCLTANNTFNDSDRRFKIVALDFGLKYNLLRQLSQRNCTVLVVPCNTSPRDISLLNPDGILISPGPGNPALLNSAVATVRSLIGSIPMMGICLGNQLITLALGGRIFKLKFGHRGSNHPVKEFATGRTYITAQNHGYAVDADHLPSDLKVTHIHLNDGTVEGMSHRELPVFSIQFHPEASPGPRDCRYVFDNFIDMVKAHKRDID